ncbi:MAG TPA: hypothetical protein DHW64_14750 [Chitinophagaceae bacterium]|nr:hypothetical protein [Chitinophagaceae bacterium]
MTLFGLQLQAQQRDTDLPGPPAKTIFGEIGGPGLFSANYDQRFKGQKGWGFRVGMGGIGFITSGVFALPVGFNHLSGKDGHYLELGAGASAITVTDGEDFFENSNSTVFGYLNFGYRYQPEKKGFTARVFVSPLITGAGVFPFYGGISAGFKF